MPVHVVPDRVRCVAEQAGSQSPAQPNSLCRDPTRVTDAGVAAAAGVAATTSGLTASASAASTAYGRVRTRRDIGVSSVASWLLGTLGV